MTADPVGTMTHIAGLNVHVGTLLRQRCAWCDAVLIDEDLERVQVMEGDDRPMGTWEPGILVAVNGIASWAVEHEDGAPVPDNSCARLDPAVTV